MLITYGMLIGESIKSILLLKFPSELYGLSDNLCDILLICLVVSSWFTFSVRMFLALQFHMVEATYRVREARKQLYSENGRCPDNEEITEVAGLTMKRFTAVMLTLKARRYLDQKIGINQSLKPSVSPTSHKIPSCSPSFSLQFLTAAFMHCTYIIGSDIRPCSAYIWGNSHQANRDEGSA